MNGYSGHSGLGSALELKGITKAYRRGKDRIPVLNDISLRVSAGEFVTLLGPSGSGKSTLFRLIGGVERPDSGRIFIEGKDTTGQRGLISYMPQQAALFPWLSVADNISSALMTAGTSKKEAKEQAAEWLERIRLGGVAKEYPHVLSGGMQQRVSFLRALLMRRDIMCLDEPFAALDALTRADMQRWLLELWEADRRSVLFVTHSIEEALLLSDRIYVLSPAPATVLSEIVVPFERPRRASVWTDPSFVELKLEVLRLLEQGK
ncbi:ABC transporter ATP-binding protein [Cohnella lupini]|uniref:ABC-type nitrate/sulfonate/bicarbonate transport system ATPase subunit n=1 Tax=Cohnella lupini TaxID=1294267 RepID=A0A3D9IWR5_9BACL|nr:ABC transporter ATP-binding protein [Cohnella lupini]RED65949.1 ABC-type nitrate/sulfonate/bicarbonate transport system ATPase subunit [Cohnella lupini]